jgi:hypothetical protein
MLDQAKRQTPATGFPFEFCASIEIEPPCDITVVTKVVVAPAVTITAAPLDCDDTGVDDPEYQPDV